VRGRSRVATASAALLIAACGPHVGASVAPTCAQRAHAAVDAALAALDTGDDPATGDVLLAAPRCGPDGWANEILAARVEEELRDRAAAAPAEELSIRAYAALNVLAILLLALRKPPTYDVPAGFPPQFPVFPGAAVARADASSGRATATWAVADGDEFEAVRVFYEDHLQQGLPGRWTVSRGSAEITTSVDDQRWGEVRYDVEGYDHDGVVTILRREGESRVTVTADLRGQR
jgi:hypothetical protein